MARATVIESMRSENKRNLLDVKDSKYEKETKRLRLLRNLTITAFLVTLFASYALLYKRAHLTNPSTQQQVAELIQIQKSLSNLQNYIEQQQKDIKVASEQLDTLSKQKGDMETALSVDRPKMEAFLTAMNRESSKGRWIEYVLSFILGIFSSLTATFGFEWWRKRQQPKETAPS